MRRIAPVLAVLAGLVVAPAASAAPPFAPDSFWNTPLAADAPLDPGSDAMVADLGRQLTQWAPYISTTSYSSPVYTVPSGQATVPVTLDSDSPAPELRDAFAQVPIPAGAVPAVGTDGHMIIHQPSTDTMWELWRGDKQANGWHASWGGKMKNVSTNPGFYTNPTNWGSTATSLPFLGGLIRMSELDAGHIDHALAMSIPEPRSGAFAFPAQRSDGISSSPDAIPEGARLRLDPALDLDSIQMAPIVRMVAEAAQRYGIVLRDKSGSISIEAEDPTPTGTDPYWGTDGWFQGKSPATLMRAFPWEHLQIMQMDLRTQPPGSVYVANGVLTVATMRNMTSDVRVEQSGTAVVVSDVNPLDAVGSKCTQVDPKRVSCAGVTAADVAGSYKGDTIRMLAPLPATLSGNTAIDKLYGGTRGDTLNGGDGDDILIPGTGADRINGGEGADYADYGARTTPLTLSLDGIANDGASGEADNLGLDVESLIGGSANDRLIGSSAGNALWGQGGDDTIDGRAGADWLNGGAGTDTADYSLRTKAVTLSPDGTANDGEAGEGDKLGADFERLFGGAGSDTILGGPAAERIEGRGGNDTLDGGAGIDVIRGDAGADTIRSRDLLIDDIACGASKDQVIGDLIDQILKKECEIRSLL